MKWMDRPSVTEMNGGRFLFPFHRHFLYMLRMWLNCRIDVRIHIAIQTGSYFANSLFIFLFQFLPDIAITAVFYFAVITYGLSVCPKHFSLLPNSAKSRSLVRRRSVCRLQGNLCVLNKPQVLLFLDNSSYQQTWNKH